MTDATDSTDWDTVVPALRTLFGSLARLPVDDPLKRQTRAFLARILSLLENPDGTPPEPVDT
jgi:hypothetical protein